MINRINLVGFDAEFFRLFADAGFLNPFSSGHREALRKLSVCLTQKQEGVCQKELFDLSMERLERLIYQFELDRIWPSPIRYDYFDAQFVPLMREVFLFWQFYRYTDQFDAFIEKQSRRPDKNLAVPFAGNMLYGMESRGFTKDEAMRGIAFFYKMRRAWYYLTRELVGSSECMRQLREDLWNCLFTPDARFYEQRLSGRMEDFDVLLSGPGGCGKGTAAGILGRCGYVPYDEERREFKENFMGLFLPVNLCRWECDYAEGEVFGREGEAAAGGKGCVGALGRCRPWGTVFLDEIGDLSGPMQVKLLEALEERKFVPVGGSGLRPFNGRVVAATGRDVEQLRRKGAFRDDLYYRLSAGRVHVPSLALRAEQNGDELRELAGHLVRQMMEGDCAEIMERVMGVIEKRRGYGWPGNVRELRQCIRRVILTGVCSAEDCGAETSIERIAAGIEQQRFTAEELTAEYCRYLYDRHRVYTDVARVTGLNWRTVKMNNV